MHKFLEQGHTYMAEDAGEHFSTPKFETIAAKKRKTKTEKDHMERLAGVNLSMQKLVHPLCIQTGKHEPSDPENLLSTRESITKINFSEMSMIDDHWDTKKTVNRNGDDVPELHHYQAKDTTPEEPHLKITKNYSKHAMKKILAVDDHMCAEKKQCKNIEKNVPSMQVHTQEVLSPLQASTQAVPSCRYETDNFSSAVLVEAPSGPVENDQRNINPSILNSFEKQYSGNFIATLTSHEKAIEYYHMLQGTGFADWWALCIAGRVNGFNERLRTIFYEIFEILNPFVIRSRKIMKSKHIDWQIFFLA
jgi:hypothetical protein